MVLRRCIGLKKDEFFLQSKRTTKNEIQSLLEGAGFSKSNPYFIVQQGKVQALCTMSDENRLRLLKEVAGTTVYDERKSESLVKMEENRNSVHKISEMLESIEERLETLSSEKDELTAYQELDRQRRAAEYSLYNLELQRARTQLDNIEQARVENAEDTADLHQRIMEIHTSSKNAESDLRTKTNQLARLRIRVSALEEDRKAALQVHTKLDLEVQELEESLRTSSEQAASNEKELAATEKEIAVVQSELDNEITPQCDKASASLQELQSKREFAMKQKDALYAKQGRGRRFSTAEERDTFLKKNEADLLEGKQEKESELSQNRDTLAQLRRRVDEETKALEKQKAESQKKEAALKTLSKKSEEKARERTELVEEQRKNWRATEELQERVRESRETLNSCQADIRRVMPRAAALGVEALRAIVEREGLTDDQYFGMVLENFRLKHTKYRTAVEAAAQNSLFHVIVDTDKTAAMLMKRLEEDQLGRVTFLPLNQLRFEDVSYPDSSDILPMLGVCFEYDAKVDRAMKHLFGKKLISRSKELAAEWSTKLSMDVLTLDGDLCGRKGALTGGYVDVNKSRLRAYANQIEAREAFRKVQSDFEEQKEESQAVDEKIQAVMQEMQRLGTKRAEIDRQLASQETEFHRRKERIEASKDQIATLESATLPDLERAISAIDSDIERLQQELGTELQHSLNDGEQKQLASLKVELEKLAVQVEEQESEVNALVGKKQKLESLLKNNLYKKREELSHLSRGDESDRRRSFSRSSTAQLLADRRRDLEEKKRSFESAARHKEELEEQLGKTLGQEEALREETIAAKDKLEKLRAEDTKYNTAWEEAQLKSERLLTKRATCVGKRESNMRKIQELGALPPQAELAKYQTKSSSSLEKALDSINRRLEKFSHVNKKAFDQFLSFNESRERLLERKDELDRGAKKVQELIESLDQKKDEAINRTFRGVSKNFRDVFKELVPNGEGSLILRTDMDEDSNSSDRGGSDDEAAQEGSTRPPAKTDNPDVSSYRAVGIKVRFSRNSENFQMSQLSGGQKALVALALIFAIQRKCQLLRNEVSNALALIQDVTLHLSTFLMSLIRL